MTAFRGIRGITPLILTHSTVWRWVVSITPCLLLPWRRNPTAIGCECGWAPRASLDVLEKRKIFFSASIQTLGHPSQSLVTVLTTLFWFPCLGCWMYLLSALELWTHVHCVWYHTICWHDSCYCRHWLLWLHMLLHFISFQCSEYGGQLYQLCI